MWFKPRPDKGIGRNMYIYIYVKDNNCNFINKYKEGLFD